MKSLEAGYIKILDFHAKIAYLGCKSTIYQLSASQILREAFSAGSLAFRGA